jgi:hypothetical protein
MWATAATAPSMYACVVRARARPGKIESDPEKIAVHAAIFSLTLTIGRPHKRQEMVNFICEKLRQDRNAVSRSSISHVRNSRHADEARHIRTHDSA